MDFCHLATLTLLLFSSTLSFSQEQQTSAKKPLIRKIDADNYTIGKVSLNKKTQEVSFPAISNGQDDIIEFVLVNDFGKTHETLFISEIKASSLNIAMKLIHYKESKELFMMFGKDGQPLNQLHEEPPEIKKAARFDIFVRWKDGEKENELHVNQLIKNGDTEQAAKIKPYIYNGSYLVEGNFMADISGDIIAIFTNPTSLANFSNEGRSDDTQWTPMMKLLPKKDTPVTLIFRKHKATQ